MMLNGGRKRCKRCGAAAPDPKSGYCKMCKALYNHRYYQQNREKILKKLAQERGAIASRLYREPKDPSDSTDGYLMIAERVVASQFRRYRHALGKYARGELEAAAVRSIENEICTPYYVTLTLHKVDLPAVCRQMREEAGLPELEESE